MPAELIVINSTNPDMNQIFRMASALRNGKLVVLPTETVYGLAANYDNAEAMKRLIELKARGEDSPFTLHLHEFEELKKYVQKIPDSAQKLAEKYWPGPMTLVLPKVGERGLGVRVVNSPITQLILKYAEVPVVATSVNQKGEKPATSGYEANQKFGQFVDYVVEAGYSQLKESSTVILIGNQTYKVKRDSLIGIENIHKTIKRKVYFLCDANRIRSVMAQAFLLKLVADEGNSLMGGDYNASVEADSAGLYAISGEEMLEGAYKVLEEANALGFVQNHRSKAFNTVMLEDADEVYVMTMKQLRQAKDYNPSQAHKLHLLDPEKKDIKDPIRKSLSAHRKVAKKILHAIEERFFNS